MSDSKQASDYVLEVVSELYGTQDCATAQNLAKALTSDDNHRKLLSAIGAKKWNFAVNIVESTIRTGHALRHWLKMNYGKEEADQHEISCLQIMILKQMSLKLWDENRADWAKELLAANGFSESHLDSWLKARDKNFEQSLKFYLDNNFNSAKEKPLRVLVIDISNFSNPLTNSSRLQKQKN